MNRIDPHLTTTVATSTAATQNDARTQGADQAAFSQTLNSAMAQDGTSATTAAASATIIAGNPMDSLAAAQLSTNHALFSAASSGTSSMQSALLMLCMMLQSGSSETVMPMLMMLSGAISQLSEDDKESLRRSILDSSYDHEVLDSVSEQVFHKTGNDAFPYEYWKPSNPSLTNSAANRSAQNYNAVIDQFGVQQNDRYAPYRNGSDTYCNIFVWDVSRAMGAEIPHYIDANTGDIVGYPPPAGALETTANRLYDWMQNHGQRYGWIEVDEQTAQQAANNGHPAMTVRKNPSGHGHVQMVRPSADGTYNAQRGAVVTQAGSRLVNYAHNGDLFSATTRGNTRYYIHP